MNLTKNFTREEMECPCCKACEMDEVFMEALQSIRTICGFGFKINSAYRCAVYNAEVSSNTRGQHATGQAVDIHVTNRYKRHAVLKEVILSGYFKDVALADTFIHLGEGNVNHGIGIY